MPVSSRRSILILRLKWVWRCVFIFQSKVSTIPPPFTSTYSFSGAEDSPSLAPGVGGICPGIGGTSPCPCLHPDVGLPSPVFGRLAATGRDPALPNSAANGLVILLALVGLCAKVSASGVLAFGLERPEGDFFEAAAFSRSSVARRRASRASSSEV